MQLDYGGAWVCAGGGRSTGICLPENEGAELLPCYSGHPPQQPAPNTNLQHPCWEETWMCKHNLPPSTPVYPWPERASSLEKCTAFLKQTWLLGQISTMVTDNHRTCRDEYHHRRQTNCRGQCRWEHQPWGWAQCWAEDILCMQRHNSMK